MKKVITLVFLMMVCFMTAQDQKKALDKIVKKDFTVIEGSVIKVTGNTVDFSYINENTINSLDINTVAKIYFSSGRVQDFTVEGTLSSGVQNIIVEKKTITFKEIKKNTVAVLPVSFLNTETHEFSDERSKYAQNDLYNEVSKYSKYTLQDLRETNNLLRLAGIDYNLLDTAPIETLQGILGVDNIVIGKVSYTVDKRQEVLTDSYSSVGTNRRSDRVYGTEFSNTSVQDDTMYDYKVYLDVYKDSQKIYSQTRVPLTIFGAGKSKWVDAMKYLIKRSPLYVK
ncbi:hypothetical protein [Flavobacterium aquidurense]|uniref:hypothetical protein n=1 Tax=Flavobacterium aquidurense TaxID=362413 RepID=UPI00285E7BCD|nr:hypothetical protein [Flavobacterium aquidurense]MDR7371723.1 hypothetical protein [Flavobacterium aquidurense]